MKTATFIPTIILTAVFSLIAGFIFARGIETKSVSNINCTASFVVINFAPVTPKEATFEPVIPMSDFSSLAPVTPNEATFEDAGDVFLLNELAPATPLEADFDDDNIIQSIDIAALAPVTPMVADFE